jgi:hypothetical protein
VSHFAAEGKLLSFLSSELGTNLEFSHFVSCLAIDDSHFCFPDPGSPTMYVPIETINDPQFTASSLHKPNSLKHLQDTPGGLNVVGRHRKTRSTPSFKNFPESPPPELASATVMFSRAESIKLGLPPKAPTQTSRTLPPKGIE